MNDIAPTFDAYTNDPAHSMTVHPFKVDHQIGLESELQLTGERFSYPEPLYLPVADPCVVSSHARLTLLKVYDPISGITTPFSGTHLKQSVNADPIYVLIELHNHKTEAA